jgi:hypothetical protein
MRGWQWTRIGVKWLALWASVTVVIWCAAELIGVFEGWKNAAWASGRLVLVWASMAWLQARRSRASRRDPELLRADQQHEP